MTETKAAPKAEATEVKAVVKAPVREKPAREASTTGKAAAPKKVNKEEMMQKHQQMVQFIQNMLGSMENDMKRIKLTLSQLAKFDPENPESVESKEIEEAAAQELKTYSEENAEVVEGKFDGYFMIG